MKKILALVLIAVLAISLVACKSEAAQLVDDQIAAIGTVTLESETAVKAAEAAYNALKPEHQEQVENYGILASARITLDALIEEERQAQLKAAAAEIDGMIDAIGTVTLESAETIAAVREAYNAADPEVQAYVSKLDALSQAETAFMSLKADEVDALIAAVGKVTLKSAEAIEAAQKAYDALSEEGKAMVENANVLADAKQSLKDLQDAEVQKLLKKLRLEADKVRGINWYYPKAFPYYESYGYWGADVRCFVLPYMGVQNGNAWLRLVCDYTDDDWVFFTKITFAVDGKNYYKYFNYFDVTRDNAYGDVWEYVDIDVGEDEIEMLWAIANSKETIVRFEGDDYYRDFTVKSKDKDAIKELLTIYEMING